MRTDGSAAPDSLSVIVSSALNSGELWQARRVISVFAPLESVEGKVVFLDVAFCLNLTYNCLLSIQIDTILSNLPERACLKKYLSPVTR
jgi:hypothetical protein